MAQCLPSSHGPQEEERKKLSEEIRLRMEVGKGRQEKEIGGGRGKRDRPRGVREAEDAKVEET